MEFFLGLRKTSRFLWAGAIVSAITACGSQGTSSLSDATGEPIPEALTAGQANAVQGLRTYCQACHAIGSMKFLRSNDDAQVWHDIQNMNAASTENTWAFEIRKVLDWPGGVTPDFSDLMEDPRDWMPKGAKRLHMADAEVEGEDLRSLIRSELALGEGLDHTP